MKSIVAQIKENELSKEYLAITEAIADIDEKLAARGKKSWWQGEEPVLSNKERVMLKAERQLLAKALMDVTARINGCKDFEVESAQIGISVDVMLPAQKK